MAMLTEEHIQGMRKPYHGKQETFDIPNLFSKDPIEQFKAWFSEAIREGTGIYEANAMTIATATKEGRPSCRMVLLKGFDENGFKFYTNYGSRKGRELSENPYAALQFYWEPLKKAVRIEGTVEKLPKKESDDYFHSRPKASQIGAVVSQQSTVIAGRQVLDDESKRLEAKYLDTDEEIPRPSGWGGYRVRPEVIEFWQGQTSRIHDRLVFRRKLENEKLDPSITHEAENGWVLERLSP